MTAVRKPRPRFGWTAKPLDRCQVITTQLDGQPPFGTRLTLDDGTQMFCAGGINEAMVAENLDHAIVGLAADHGCAIEDVRLVLSDLYTVDAPSHKGPVRLFYRYVGDVT
jgi:hypothetical protein